MSPVGQKLRSRSLKFVHADFVYHNMCRFPGLISGCTICWIHPWPKEALYDVASASLEAFDIAAIDMVKKNLLHFMAAAHKSVQSAAQEFLQKMQRPVHVTPKSYLVFIDR